MSTIKFVFTSYDTLLPLVQDLNNDNDHRNLKKPNKNKESPRPTPVPSTRDWTFRLLPNRFPPAPYLFLKVRLQNDSYIHFSFLYRAKKFLTFMSWIFDPLSLSSRHHSNLRFPKLGPLRQVQTIPGLTETFWVQLWIRGNFTISQPGNPVINSVLPRWE